MILPEIVYLDTAKESLFNAKLKRLRFLRRFADW